MRIALAVLFMAHGFAHVIGFASAWGISPNIPHRRTVLDGHVELPARHVRLLGVAWLACALAFVTAGAVVLLAPPWWPGLVTIVACVSFVLCIVQLPDTRIGLVLNAAILAALFAGRHAGWLT